MARILRQSPLTLVVLAFLLLLGGFIAWNLATPEQDARVFAIRQKGYPSSLRELDEWYTHIPDSQNAALIYTNAFSQPALTNYSGSTMALIGDTNWVPARGQLISKEFRAELGAVLATNQAVLDLLHSASTLTNSRYPVDLAKGFQVLLPHLAKVKGSVQLLTAEAMLHASNGDIEKALAALHAAGAVADSMAEEPLLISQLVRVASWAIICKRSELMLNGATLSDQQLNTLQTFFHNAERPDSMVRGLAGERASGLAVFMGSPDQFSIFVNVDSDSRPALKDRLRASLYIGLLKSTGILRKDRSFYLDVMATNVAAAEAPFPKRLTLAQQANTAAMSPPSKLMIFSRMLLPALSRAMQRDGDHTARIRTAQTATAIERFRRAHSGNLPGDLKELVPTYLASVPEDPFDGQPLRFKQLTKGYVVYSIGSDLRDDGGSEGDPNKRTAAKDITFILER
jgi:hypothetical protein